MLSINTVKNMRNNNHIDGKKLIGELENLLDNINHYSSTVDQYVITSSTDLYGNITSVSQAFCDISGYNEAELIGNNHNLVRHPDMPDSLYKDLWQTIKSGKTWNGEVKNRKKNGEFYWVDVHIDPIKNHSGEVTGYIAVRQDITDKKHIESLTITDELTGSYNRRYYNQVLSVEIDRAKRDGQFLCFLMIDADNFKKYNDTYGHQSGDEVLKTIVESMNKTFKRAGDYVFRLGGEEFAVLFRVEQEENARTVSEIARTALYDCNIPHSGNPPHQRVTISMGLMILEPSKAYIEDEIYKYADEALYKAKENGRNRVELHATEDDIELF